MNHVLYIMQYAVKYYVMKYVVGKKGMWRVSFAYRQVFGEQLWAVLSKKCGLPPHHKHH